MTSRDVPASAAAMPVLTARAAARMVGVDEATIRQWRARGYLVPVAQTQVGPRRSNWYRRADVWECARRRLSGKQREAIDTLWAEVDQELANAQVNRHSVA